MGVGVSQRPPKLNVPTEPCQLPSTGISQEVNKELRTVPALTIAASSMSCLQCMHRAAPMSIAATRVSRPTQVSENLCWTEEVSWHGAIFCSMSGGARSPGLTSHWVSTQVPLARSARRPESLRNTVGRPCRMTQRLRAQVRMCQRLRRTLASLDEWLQKHLLVSH